MKHSGVCTKSALTPALSQGEREQKPSATCVMHRDHATLDYLHSPWIVHFSRRFCIRCS